MEHSRSKLVTALVLFTMHVAAKNNARPVYEVINEQARMDDIRLSSAPAVLPYGNPLAGNSAQNARLHASNQQAMFNAEKIRQHKAQLQRLTQGPPIIDSYMKAYHESQESHQQQLEQQQSNIKDVSTTPTTPRKPTRTRIPQRQRTSNRERNSQKEEMKPNVQPEKINRNVRQRNRNHRSYDSVEYEQFLRSKLPLAYLSTDQVAIKPNGYAGVEKEQDKESTNAHTIVLEGSGKYLPKTYHSIKEIDALESILSMEPNKQLTELKTLLESDTSSLDNIEKPLKDLSEQHIPKYYSEAVARIPTTYTSDFTIKDYKPITEEIDDIENPIQYQAFVKPELSTISPIEPAVTNNYYKVEVASQTIHGVKPDSINEELHLNNENINESYLNSGSSPLGLHHLAEDGTGVSAYGDESLHYASNYEFGYRVRNPDSGNYFGQYEAKSGEKTHGNYHVLLPDGRMQKVEYSAGPSGYHADISYDHLNS